MLLDGDSHTKFESRLHGVGERNSPDVIRAIQSVRLTWEAINRVGTSYTMVLERRCRVPFVRLRTTGSSGTTPPNTTNATTTSTTSGGSTGMDQRIIDLSAMPPLPTTVSRRSIFTLLSFFPFVSTLFIIVEARWGTEAINRWRSNN